MTHRVIEVNVRVEGLGDLLVLARNILSRVTRIEAQGVELMAVGVETQRVITAIDAATNAIAARLEQIVADADLTAEEKALFEPIVARLEALGSDPANPVPAS